VLPFQDRETRRILKEAEAAVARNKALRETELAQLRQAQNPPAPQDDRFVFEGPSRPTHEGPNVFRFPLTVRPKRRRLSRNPDNGGTVDINRKRKKKEEE
jgi:hypothetical protein